MKTIWFDVEQEHRRLYEVKKGSDGTWYLYFDRCETIELSPYPMPIPRLEVANVMTFAKMPGAKGVYLILTETGGAWGGYILRRKYTPEERQRIQVAPDEREPDKADRNRARIARRNGKAGGRKRKEEANVDAAVKAIMDARRKNCSLRLLPACRFCLKTATPALPIKAERLAQLVRKRQRLTSGRN